MDHSIQFWHQGSKILDNQLLYKIDTSCKVAAITCYFILIIYNKYISESDIIIWDKLWGCERKSVYMCVMDNECDI